MVAPSKSSTRKVLRLIQVLKEVPKLQKIAIYRVRLNLRALFVTSISIMMNVGIK